MKDRFGEKKDKQPKIIQTRIRRASHGNEFKPPQEVQIQIITGSKVKDRSK